MILTVLTTQVSPEVFALFLAMSSPDELDILGITTVAGNVPLALTQRSARMICDIAGRQDVPVFAGRERPLVLFAGSAWEDAAAHRAGLD